VVRNLSNRKYKLGRFMPGFDNDVLFCSNVDFRGIPYPIQPQVLADGQLLIGSAVAPNIRIGTLTQPAAGITITGGPGSITFALANDLAALEGLGTVGVASRSAADTWIISAIVDHAVLCGGPTSSIANIGPLTDGQLLIGRTGNYPLPASLTSSNSSITITPGVGSISLTGTQSTTAQLGSVTLATSAETLIATDASKVITPATLNSMLSQSDFTGFVSWSGAGPYFDDTTLGTFQLLRGGTGFIKSKQVTWVAQNITGLTAGNTYYIYIDSTGTIGKSSSRTDALYINNIVLFECLRDSTPVTNNQVTVKENHPYDYPTATSNYEHDNIGTLIENNAGGANITLNGTQKIQINGADVLSDHGLETVIPNSGGVGVTWIKMYTDGAGKWSRQNSSDTFSGFYNNAGTPTALGATKFAVYTLYVSKDTLTSSTPTYFAVLDTSQYNNLTGANTAISNGTTAKASNELSSLEICQLGYIVFGQAANAIVQVTIAKSTLRASISTSGTNVASLVNTNTAAFDGWLSAANTTVQSSLDTLDDVLKGGTAGQLVVSSGGVAMPVYTTATYPTTTGAGEMLLSNSANAVISSASMTGNFTFTSATAAVDRTVTISNTDNSAVASQAHLQVTVGGSTSTGDPYENFLVTGAGTYSIGIDNSVAGDPFKITASATPSAGSDLFTMTSTGVITLANDLDVSEGGTGVSTLTSHGILLGNGASDIQATAEPSNGQLLVGKTGDFPQLAALTPGMGIAITNGAGSITVSAWGGGVSWTVETVNLNFVANKGIIANKAGLLTVTLPATASIGDILEITGINTAVGWRIAQNANQRIHLGASSSTVGAGGYIEATAIRDSVKLVCVVAGASTEYNAISVIGNITVV
jgi:hypothetical protein